MQKWQPLSKTLAEYDHVNTDNGINPHHYQCHRGFDGGDQRHWVVPNSETRHLLQLLNLKSPVALNFITLWALLSLLFQIFYHMSWKCFTKNIKRHRKNLVGNRILAIVKHEILLIIISVVEVAYRSHCAHSQRRIPLKESFGVKKLCCVWSMTTILRKFLRVFKVLKTYWSLRIIK
jgi:hypothetical protein